MLKSIDHKRFFIPPCSRGLWFILEIIPQIKERKNVGLILRLIKYEIKISTIPLMDTSKI